MLALATLGIVNTGVGYWLFYLLIDEAGAATVGAWLATRPRQHLTRHGHESRIEVSSREIG